MQTLTGCKLQHVIARSGATWQSASPQRYLASRSYLGRIRGAFRIRLKWCFAFCAAARRTDCHRCAHWFAMTCKRQRRFSECKDMAQGCYWERYLQTLTGCKLQHVIARSEATRQSASPQRYLASRSYLGRIRGAFRIRLKWCFAFCAAARRTDCHTSVRTGSQ